ncbi:hypothetical protein ACVXG9_28905 [Escherichia coli]
MEHQALVRARVVYGDPQLTAHFDAVRREIMTLPREGKTLQTEVREMREKCALLSAINIAIALISKLMKGELPISNLLPNIWCCATLMKTEVNALVRTTCVFWNYWRKNDIMEEQEAMALTRAYTTLRDELHHLALQELPGHVSEDCFTAERELVRQAGRSGW